MSTQSRVTRLTAISKASGVIDYLNRASLRLRFNKGEVDPRIISGATTMGWLFDQTGTLRARPHNLIRNSVMQGAVAGVPGTPPTNWSFHNGVGLTRSIVGTGVEDGLNYVDVNWTGTTSGSLDGAILAVADVFTAVPALAGQTYSGSFNVKLISAAGSLSGFSSIGVQITERNSSSGLIAASSSANISGVISGAGLGSQRYSHTRLLQNAATAFLTCELRGTAAAGVAFNFTLRIATPQLNLGELQPYYPTTGAPFFGPRLTYDPANLSADPGLLAEEARTNSIRNSTMQGAVAGTPGTLPTNWSAFPTAGLARSVVGVGIENGIPYVDIRFSGTTTASGLSVLYFEANNAVAASSAQVWTASSFVKMVGGSLTGLSFVIGVDELNSSGGFLAGSVSTTTPSSVLVRFSHTRTLTNTSTAFLRPFIYSNVASGATIDITLRIGLPQLELGASASSPIPTSSTAVTRSADNPSMTDMSWYQQSGGVLYTDSQSVAFTQRIAALTDGTANNSCQQYVNSTVAGMDAYVAGVFQGNGGASGVFQTNTRYKVASRIVANNAVTAINGAIGTTDTSYSLPTVDRLLLGQARTAQSSVGTLIREIAFIPLTNIPDSALQRMTR